MIMSSSPVTSGNENDSQVRPERVLVVTRWLGAYTGCPLDRIVLPREPATEEERLWVETELRTRLVPGGQIEVTVENGSQVQDTDGYYGPVDSALIRLIQAGFGEIDSQERRCRGCGCTDAHACPEGCWWVEKGLSPLCSSCTNPDYVGPFTSAEHLEIDVTPIPQPPVDHYLELEGDDGIRATLVCKSAPGAACRMVHDCQCEEYCACEPPSQMVDSGECNVANWINGDFDAAQEGAYGTRILVPVDTAWNDDHFEWTFVPGITK